MYYHYEQYGNGAPLILLHGFTGNSANWRPFIEPFKRRFNVLIFDLPGHGQSDRPAFPEQYAMEKVAQDLAKIFSRITDETIHLLGYSMGGRLALYLGIHYPERLKSLTLESASPGLKAAEDRLQRIQRDETLANSIEMSGMENFVNHWERIPLFASQQNLPEETRLQLRQQRMRNAPSGLANSLRGMGTGRQPSLWEKLSALNIPTRLIVGELDHKFTKINQEMAQLLPQAELSVVAEAGHTVHLEQPDLYGELIMEFLNRIENSCAT